MALLGLYAVFGLTRVGVDLDQGVRAAHRDDGGLLSSWAGDLLGVLTPLVVIAVALILVVMVWRRAGVRAGIESAVGIGSSLALAEGLKRVLPKLTGHAEAFVIGRGSFPSGHVAVTTALMLVLLAGSPPRLERRLSVPAALLPAVIAVSTVAAGAHRPSAAVGGVLVAFVTYHGVRALSRRSEVVAIPPAGSRADGAPGRRHPYRRAQIFGGALGTLAFGAVLLMMSTRGPGSPAAGYGVYVTALVAVWLAATALMALKVRWLRGTTMGRRQR